MIHITHPYSDHTYLNTIPGSGASAACSCWYLLAMICGASGTPSAVPIPAAVYRHKRMEAACTWPAHHAVYIGAGCANAISTAVGTVTAASVSDKTLNPFCFVHFVSSSFGLPILFPLSIYLLVPGLSLIHPSIYPYSIDRNVFSSPNHVRCTADRPHPCRVRPCHCVVVLQHNLPYAFSWRLHRGVRTAGGNHNTPFFSALVPRRDNLEFIFTHSLDSIYRPSFGTKGSWTPL